LPPATFIVESGGVTTTERAKLHLYWALEPSIDPELARTGKRRLAVALSSDSAVSDPARVMRMPCSRHFKEHGGTGREVRVIDAQPKRRYALDDIVGGLPELTPPALPETPAEGNGTIPVGERHTTAVSVAGALRYRGIGEEGIRGALHGLNTSAFESPSPDKEIDRIARDFGKKPVTPVPDKPMTDAGADWPELSAREVPPFPVDVLPPDVREFVLAVSDHSQTPPDLAAFDALGVLATSAFGAAILECSWGEEELGLYLIIPLPSGERKSYVLKRVRRPLNRIAEERRLAAEPRIRKQRARRRGLEGRLKKLAARMDSDDSTEREQAEREYIETEEELARMGEPVEPRMFADDATPEQLARLLSDHGKIAVLAAESALIDNLLGRYGDGSPNLHAVCAAYSGEETTIDRRSDESRHLDRPLMTILLSPQPHVLAKLAGNEIATQQGLVARFAIAIPESRLGLREVGIKPIPEPVEAAWEAIVRRVASVGSADNADDADRAAEFSRDPNVSNVSNVSRSRPVRLTLSTEAQALLDDLQRQIEPRLAADGDLRSIAAWTNRHHGRVARIAALLHLCDHDPSQPIDESTMRAALRIGTYLMAHARAALAMPDETTRRALAWIENHGQPSVTQREIHRRVLGGRGAAKVAQALADRLVMLGALRELRSDHSTQRRFEVNPGLLPGTKKLPSGVNDTRELFVSGPP